MSNTDLEELITQGAAHRSPPGTPPVIDDITDVPSLSDAIIRDRQEETR